VRWTCVARQTLVPCETPVCALCPGEDFLRGGGDWRVPRRGGALQANRFAAYYLQPCSSDATAWPIFPQHRSTRERRRCVFERGRNIRECGGERPQHRTHPSRFDTGMAFLTLRTQRTGATMADARRIE